MPVPRTGIRSGSEMKMMKKEAGFTLIEVIVSLIIIGIITAFAGMAIVTGVKGYVFARDNASVSQKAQLAMSRVSRELMELTNITTANASRITYERLEGNYTIYTEDNKIKIASGGSPSGGDELVDYVSSFALTYNPDAGGNSTWSVGNDIQLLYAVKISFDLTRSDGSGDVAFSTTVNPRNNKNDGGTP